jgi:hypothetical protein
MPSLIARTSLCAGAFKVMSDDISYMEPGSGWYTGYARGTLIGLTRQID